MRLPIRIRVKRKWKVAAVVLLCAAAAAYALWQTSGFVSAFRQVKRAHIFPTSVSAVGWENGESALGQDLSAQAPYAAFNKGNSAYIFIQGTTSAPAPQPAGGDGGSGAGGETPAAPPADNTTSSAAAGTAPADAGDAGSATTTPPVDAAQPPAAATPATTSPIVPADAGAAPSEQLLPDVLPPAAPDTSAPQESPAPSSMKARTPLAALGSFGKFIVAHTATIALATTSDEAQTTTPQLPPASEPAAPASGEGVAACTVLGTECHTIAFGDFAVGGSLEDKEFKKAELNFSFANNSIEAGALDGKLAVRYFHNGHWRSAGEIYLNKEISNATNGKYFSQALDDVTSWSDIKDVQVVFEYEPGDGSGPVELYLDAVWLDAVYMDPVQDVLAGSVSDPADAPQNVSFDLAQGDKGAKTLILENGEKISFDYLNSLSDDALQMRADQVSYAPPQAASSSVVYVSVTNTQKTADSFTLYASFPGGKGSISGIAEYLRNVPDAATSTDTADLAYFCDSGWSLASSTDDYSCAATGETYQCASLSDTGSNCVVPNVAVGTATSTSYLSAWVDSGVRQVPEGSVNVQGLPRGYATAYASGKQYDILQGQTVYFKIALSAPDTGKLRFVLSAMGGTFSGNLDSMHLRDETNLLAQEKTKKAHADRKHLNDQLSEKSDFNVDEKPEFHFKFKTQRSLFTQIKDTLLRRQVPYAVQSAELRHESGEIEHLPIDIEYGTNDEWTLRLNKEQRAFRPGKYTVDLSMTEGAEGYSDSVSFYWGVLALNPDKSSYEPGDTAHLELAALDDSGNTMCDAQLVLSVTSPSGTTSDVPVVSGGGCGRNNVTTLPDFVADYQMDEEGTYALELSRLDDAGNIVTSITDSLAVVKDAPYVVTRSGPTRIFPQSAYGMHIAVSAPGGFTGDVVETLPEGFVVGDSGGASISREQGVIHLTWHVTLVGGQAQNLSYTFKAPEVSPYMYLAGPLTLSDTTGQVFSEGRAWKIASDATLIATGVAWLGGNATTNGTNLNSGTPFALTWNLSSEYDDTYFSHSTSTNNSQLSVLVAGDYLVAITVPQERADTNSSRTTIEADVRVNGGKANIGVSRSFIRTISGNNESSNHLYVLLRGLQPGDYIESYVHNLTTITDPVTIGTRASMYAEYIGNDQSVYFGLGTTTTAGTNLNPAATSTMVWYDDSSLGRADSNYTHSNAAASTTVTLAAAGDYMVFVNIPVSGGVANASPLGSVLINGTLVSGGYFRQGYIDNTSGATDGSLHWSGVVHATTTNEKLSVTLIADSTAGTLTANSDTASLYVQKLPAADIYFGTGSNTTGGTNWNSAAAVSVEWSSDTLKDTSTYTHSTTTNSHQITVSKAGDYLLALNDSHSGAVTRSNEITSISVNGSARSGAQTKTHFIRNNGGASHTNSSGSLVYLLRDLAVNDVITVTTVLEASAGTVIEDVPAQLMLWHKASQSSFVQDTERWYANVNGEPPTDPWPTGAVNLGEGEAITTGNSVKSADVLRLRMALKSNVSTLAGADSFKLQYAEGSSCSLALAWADVGAIGSGAIWRGYDNASVAAGSTLSSTTLSVATTTQTYEEQNPSAVTPSSVAATYDSEWDWAIQDNGATAGSSYCFRMVQSNGQILKDYLDYPQLVTNNTPTVPQLLTPFENEKAASTSPWFTFGSSDENGEDIHYEIQVSTDPLFGSTVIDDDSVSFFSKFTDLVNTADKAPFATDETVQYVPTSALTSGTTYWWRVRGKDPSGTGTWSSYSAARSITIGTATTSTWFQTTRDQFNTDTLSQVAATSSDDLRLSGANTTGTVWSPEIDFSVGTIGNAWGNFTWNDSHASGTILYKVEYLTSTSSWAEIPSTDLPGNSTGTSTKPIKLTTLDPTAYPSIRLRADFTRTTNTPILYDWTLTWAQQVSKPTIVSPFDNEKVPTTTPTFQFTTTEPDLNNLVYQIQWSTDAVFATGVSSSTSSTGAGFADISSTTATSPFPSGDSVTYTIQTANRLASSTTYWWRARAIAPSGGNTYSLWSSPQSFTTDTTVQASTWFQKTFDQFSNDTLTLTLATSTGVTASSDTGKIAIYRAAAAAESITTGTFTNGFDTNVRQDDIYSKTGTTTINLNKGHYAVFYGVRFDSTGGTNRAVIQNDLNVGGQSLAAGWSQAFVRDSTPSLESLASGGAIIKVTSDATPLKLQSFRTDTNPSELVARVANTSGLQVIKLDDSWPYIRLSKTAKQSGPTSAAWRTVTYDREDEINTSAYTHSTNSSDITLVSTGHYLVFVNTYGSLASGVTNDTMVDQKLTLNSSDVEGSFTTVYMRGNTNTNGIYEGAASLGMIIESTTSNATLNVQLARSVGTSAWTIDSNSAGTYVNRSAITVVKLPEADFIRLQHSTNTQNINPTTLTALNWDTEAEKDSTTFTHSNVTNSSRIQVNSTGDYLMLTSNYANAAPVANSEFNQGWELNGGALIQYGQTIGYNDTTTTHVGRWSANIFPSVSATNYFEVVTQALGVTGNVLDAKKGVQGVRIASLSDADTNEKSVQSPDIVFTNGSGPKWSTFSWTDTRPGSSTITYQLYYLDASSTYSLVPDSALAGNAAGFTAGSSSVNISNLSRLTYGTLQTKATLTCSNGCPTLNTWTVNWSQGINISGTAKQFDQTTNIPNGDTVRVAVNGALSPKTTTISGGVWTIPNVNASTGDIITVFISTTTASARAVAVTKYTGTNDITGMRLNQLHLSLGSDDLPTLSNSDISLYDNSVSGNSAIFDDVSGGNLTVCAVANCDTARLLIKSGTTFEPGLSGGNVTTPNIQIDGTLIADANTISVSHSWKNNYAFAKGTSAVVFTATSTAETVDSSAASTSAFASVTFGQTSGTATWTLSSPLLASSTLAINFGTLQNGTNTLMLSSDLAVGSSGVFRRGTGSTTFMGSGTNTWTDNSAAKQDMGDVFIDGSSKTIQLGSNVKATNITIGADDTLSASASNYNMTVLGNWTNNNLFVPQIGTVTFAATTTGKTIAPGSSGFYNATFNGAGGNWAFSGGAVTVSNDLTISTGTVTLPTGTTTVGGSFDASGGAFIHNNGTVYLTASGSKTVAPGTSSFYDLTFNGSGSWTLGAANATSSRNFIITSGTVTMPSGTLAVGGTFAKNGGSFTHNSGTIKFTASTPQTVKLGASSASSLLFAGAGTWTLADTNAAAAGTVTIAAGTVVLPPGTFTVGGSWLNTGGTFTHNNGAVLFNAASTGFLVTPASSAFYDVAFSSASGGWTITGNATSTHDFSLTSAASFAVASSTRLAVGGTFTNAVGGSATALGSSTLALTSGTSYSINTKSAGGDFYGVISLAAGNNIRMWNSSSASTSLASTASLYSQNHAGVSGALNIYGAFSNAANDYWDYAKDFDGTALGGGSRQVNVRIASSSSVTVSAGSLEILGTSTASTTVYNQGAGTYAFSVTGGTFGAQYYQIASTSAAGLSISGAPTVSSLSNGDFTLSIPSGGTSLTLASTVINANPAMQIQRVRFATSTGVTSGFNVTESGAPTSYWWFRSHYGNFAGEANDNDPGPNSGNPGYIRWDDSGYNITVAGHVYANHGTTVIGNPPCDGSTAVVAIVIGGSTYTGSCAAGSGAYSIAGVQFSGDTSMTVFLNTNGGKRAVTVTKTPTADIADLDLYQDALIVRQEGVTATSIADLAAYDQTKDSDVFFAAATTSVPNTLVVQPEKELYVWAGKTFAPGGNVTLQSGGSGSLVDGRLFLASSSAFTAAGTEAHSIGGGLFVQAGAAFSAANSTITFTATTTGKTIYSSPSLSFYNLTFNGTGGVWSIVSTSSPTVISHALAITGGTLAGTGDVTVQSGDVAGSGTISMAGGTFLILSTGNLGSTNAWQFNNLTLGDGISTNTTTKVSAGTTTVTGVLTIAANQTLNGGASPWVLSGGGTPFVITGAFAAQSAPFTYSSVSATTIANAGYAALTLAPSAAGNPTYTLSGGTPTIGSLTVGNGTNPVTVTADTNDPSIAISGTMQIGANATYIASNVGAFNVGRSWLNSGTFTSSGAGVLFNATTTGNTITASTSPFYDITFNSSSGGWTIAGNATSTHDFSLTNAASFTQAPGTTLAVGGTFTNGVGGSATAFATSTLALTSGTSYSINTKSDAGDIYGTLSVAASTNIRMWNSSAATTTVSASGSLYSMNHAGVSGALNIWGAYSRSTGSDYWSYATDFDGTAIGGRQVQVQIASSSSVSLTGGLLDMIGSTTATTTVANQGAGTYSLSVSGGTLNAQYYQIRNTDVNGLSMSGSPTISSLSNGDFQLAIAGGSTMTVAGTVIDANPLRIIRSVKFATTTAITGFNAKATGTSASSWKFNLHYGNLAGEAFDSDPAGDPGYLRWDDSASQITISGHVYTDEGVVAMSSPTCDNSTQNVKLVVQGGTSYTSSCNSSTGAYSISGISFNPGDTLTLYLDTNGGKRAADISVDPISNITNMDLYENRVIVRHEDTAPITIAKIAQYTSANDADIPFATTLAATNTMTLPPNTKLIVWDGKTFAPAGNVTIQSGTSTGSFDGSLEVRANATFSAAGSQLHSLGGSLIFDSGSSLISANSTFIFTATTTGKTITPPASSAFYNMKFAGAGGNWAFSGNATTTNDFTVATGTVTLPNGTLAVGGSFIKNTSGTFVHNNGTLLLNSTASGKSIQVGTSSLYSLTINGSGGAWTFLDSNATTSNNFTIAAGTVTLPPGTLAVGSSFINSGTFAHNSGTVKLTSTATGKSVQAGGSSFNGLTFSGAGGGWTFLDSSATALATTTVASGTVVLPSGTLTLGGSLLNTGGAFSSNGGTVSFTAASTGNSVTTGTSTFYNVAFNSASGGWTITGNSTSTNDFSLTSAASFAVASSTRLAVGGTFTNAVGGSATALGSSTLALTSGTSYSINTKSAGGDTYGTLALSPSTNIRVWNSSFASTSLSATTSIYSMNHGGVSGALNIYGTYSSTGSDYWDYAKDFDGTAIGGRQVQVQIASSSSVTSSSGLLEIIGIAGATTTIANQGAGSYALSITGGTLNAQYYQIRNTDINGLSISGSPTVSSLSNGDFQLSASSTMITLSGSAVDANASLHVFFVRFATSSGVTGGFNIKLSGSTANAWTFSSAYGNRAGEGFDSDGTDACGNIRWDDSSCLFVNQAHYRWRNDNGDEGALSTEWYNVAWTYRKKVAVTNPTASAYTNYPVKLTVAYDAAMKSDFSDLRFTDSTGTTSLAYWIESSTAATSTVWVNVPSLPASGSATIYMYFGNAAASDASDGTGTFGFFESFDSNTLAAYSGDGTTKFQTGTSFAHNGTYGLDAGSHSGEKTTNGIYRTGSLTGQGKTIRFFQYVDASQQDEPCTLFGAQSSGHNYAVCLDEYPTGAIEIAKNVTANDGSGTVLASTTASYSTGWYEVSIDWLATNAINVTVYNSSGAVFATLNTTDSTYTSGGMGFSYWFQHGGWDFYTSRQYASSQPTAIFGSRQGTGGATWAAAEDTALGSQTAGSNIRLRFSVQNTGSDLTSQNFRLQVAPKGAALNCESVPDVSYSAVPPQSTCVASGLPACMTTSAQFTNLASTSPSLSYPASMKFSPGEIMEDPSNDTNGISVVTNSATEVEYNFQLTGNATGNAYCFRTSKAGVALDSYDHVAQVTVVHAPTIGTISFNGLQSIMLTEGTTTLVQASSTVTDLNGYTDMIAATSTFFRSGVGSACSASDTNCYKMATSSCLFSACAGNSCTLTCSANFQYFADPTDTSTTSQHWYANMSVVDSSSLYGTATSSYIDLLTLYGLSLNTASIDFHSLLPGADTGSTTATTTIINTGNSPININLSGNDLTGPGGAGDKILVNTQKYATSTFAYGSCALCQLLTGSATNVAVNIPKQTSTSTQSTGNLYWGISVPVGKGGTYSGSNTFEATGP